MLEFNLKQNRLMNLLEQNQLDGILLRRVSSFAWATCGAAAYVNAATSTATAALLVTHAQRYLITDNIEAPRFEKEEKLRAQGWEFLVTPWHTQDNAIGKLAAGRKIGSDLPLRDEFDLRDALHHLRAQFTPDETVRFRMLGHLCAAAMQAAVNRVKPGMTEHEIAGVLAHEAEHRGVQAVVNLVASDERIYAFRHPLPSLKKLEKYALLVLCGRRGGLVCSLSRLVHFGSLSTDLQDKARATAGVDAAFHVTTRPGKTLDAVLSAAIQAYADYGYADEWLLHHQGGVAGYEPREILARPGCQELIALGQACAWNPSITGTKSEDSLLVGEKGNEVVTEISGWPNYEVEYNGQVVRRPAILEIN